MKDKFVDKFIQPKVQATAFVSVVLICCLLYYNMIFGFLGFGLLCAAIVYEGYTNRRKKKAFSDYIENLTTDMDMTVKKNIVTNPLPICIMDRSGNLEWYNRKFADIFPEKELIYTNLHQLIPAFRGEELLKKKPDDAPMYVNINERVYKIAVSTQGEEEGDNMFVLYFLDVTAFDNLKKMYKDEKSCAVHIYIDNYEELLLRAEGDNRITLSSQIEVKIRQFAQKNKAPM